MNPPRVASDDEGGLVFKDWFWKNTSEYEERKFCDWKNGTEEARKKEENMNQGKRKKKK
jgi:hypothetical protein